jgi:hypothetical protein
MSTAFLYLFVVTSHMAVNESHAVAPTTTDTAPMTSDRYCRHCREIALVYDPDESRGRCRSCGELA